MAHFVKVEFSIKDVKRPSPKRRGGQRPIKQSPTRKVVTIKDGFTEHKDHNVKENVVKFAPTIEEHHQSPVLTHDGMIRTASPPRKNIHIDHHIKTIHRINRADKLPSQRTLQSEMYFSIKTPDLDQLRTEQELIISNFRMQHLSNYEDFSSSPRLPELKKEENHVATGHLRFTPRYRTLPKTTGHIVNDTLPFYPKLKEDADHGIHNKRWCVMTVTQDDPDRLLPQTTRPTTSHEDFERVFKGKNKEREESRVMKLRDEDLVC